MKIKWISSLILTFVIIFSLGIMVSAIDYQQAPELDQLVENGQLPPVEERLPEEPLVVEPVEEIGQYGGTWRMVTPMGYLPHVGFISNRYQFLADWSSDLTKVVPNLAKSWDVEDNARIYTIHLRKGVKWSDGKLLTVDDIMFWYNKVILNKELTPAFPDWLLSGGKQPQVKKIDDYTIKFEFVEPKPFFPITNMAFNGRIQIIPAHYLRNFHPDFVDEEKLNNMTEEEGFDKWYQLFEDKNDFWVNPERPTITPWVLKNPITGATSVTLERNPYFWKVDPEGNQLPYIDKQRIQIVESLEVAKMKAIAGEVDMQGPPVGENFMDYPLLAENRDRGNYRLITTAYDEPNVECIWINFNHKDPVKKELFQDKDFRIALSLAINRQDIIDLHYSVGPYQAEPRHYAPVKESPYYSEKLAKQYTEYKPEQARKLLDDMGLTERDSEGYRLGTDGEKLTITIEIPTYVEAWIDVAQLVAGYWQDIGLRTAVKPQDPALWSERWSAGDHDVSMSGLGQGGLMVPTDGYSYAVDSIAWHTQFAPLWAQWNATDGESGTEPSAEIKEVYHLWQQIKATADADKQDELINEMLDIWEEGFFVPGISTRLPRIYLMKNYFHNVPDMIHPNWRYGNGGHANPSQFFIEQ